MSVSLFGDGEEDHAEQILFPKPAVQGDKQQAARTPSLSPRSSPLAVLGTEPASSLTVVSAASPAPPDREPGSFSEAPATDSERGTVSVSDADSLAANGLAEDALEPSVSKPPALAVLAPGVADEIAGTSSSASPQPFPLPLLAMASGAETVLMTMEVGESSSASFSSTPILEASNSELGVVAMQIVAGTADTPVDHIACTNPSALDSVPVAVQEQGLSSLEPTPTISEQVDTPTVEVTSAAEDHQPSLSVACPPSPPTPPPSAPLSPPLASPQQDTTPSTPLSAWSTPSRGSVALLRSYYSSMALGKSPSMTPKISQKLVGASSPNKRFDSGLYNRLNSSHPMSFHNGSPSHRPTPPRGASQKGIGQIQAEEGAEEVWSFEVDEFNFDSTTGGTSRGVTQRGLT